MSLRAPTAFFIGICLIRAAPGLSAELTSGSAVAPPGGSMVVPISMAALGDTVSGIQFDIQYDPALSISLGAGDALRSADKALYLVDVGPQSKRVVIAGLNPNTIQDGPVVNLFVSVGANAAPGTYGISLSSVSAAGPTGDAVPVVATDGAITVQGTSVSLALQASGVVSAASLMPGPVAPGEIVTLMGSGFTAGSSTVLFDGIAAPLLYVGATQINAVVPYGVASQANTILEVTATGLPVVSLSVPVAPAAPGIFTLDGSGTGTAAALNQDGRINGPANPALPGSIVSLFASGAGQTNPPGIDGQIAANPLPLPLLPVAVKIAGMDAEVQYAGAAPGLIAGVLQLNCRVPPGSPGGNLPIIISVGGVTSPAGVTLTVW